MKFVVACGLFALIALIEGASIAQIEPESSILDMNEEANDPAQELTREKRHGGYGGYGGYGGKIY